MGRTTTMPMMASPIQTRSGLPVVLRRHTVPGLGAAPLHVAFSIGARLSSVPLGPSVATCRVARCRPLKSRTGQRVR